MRVAVQSKVRLNSIALPTTIVGTHWILDADGFRVASAEAHDGSWVIEPGDNLHALIESGEDRIVVDPQEMSVVNIGDEAGWRCALVFSPESLGALRGQTFSFDGDACITVGRNEGNSIVYPNEYVSGEHLTVAYRSGRWSVTDLDSTNGTFLNGCRLESGVTAPANYGDVLTLLDMHIVLGCGVISFNNPSDMVKTAAGVFDEPMPVEYETPTSRRPRGAREYFYPALRFMRGLEPKQFRIDPPPVKEREDKTPLLMKIGPSALMGFTSLLSACVFISMMTGEGSSMIRAIPMAAMAITMLMGSVLWPILNDKHQRAEREKGEALRRNAYAQYLSGVLSEIEHEQDAQREILLENRISATQCIEMAKRSDPHLMDRTPLHADYLDVRLGLGDEDFLADIRFPDEHFSVEDDDLRDAVFAEARTPRVLHDVPLALSLIDKRIAGVVGEQGQTDSYLRGLVAQIAALHSYEEVKIVVLCDASNYDKWSFALHLPHCFSDDKKLRYFGCALEEVSEVGMFLERVMEERASQERFDARESRPYYVVFCPSEEIATKAGIVSAISGRHDNLGVSLVASARYMRDLPAECRIVVGLEATGAYVLDRDDPSGTRKPLSLGDFISDEVVRSFAYDLSRVRLDLGADRQQMPARLGFLEMLGYGNVEQLNIENRWKSGNASATLACRVGVDAQGEPFLLNLHERFHGPHGLIAGTTGSGKSEFIITYILSMALNYSPDDVAFVLIDYKGGGLARAFENEHVRLPHLAGVITNLDGAAISRSLVSIQSELKRRQALFNAARDRVGGDNVDIYDYLDLYRQGRVDDLGPCPHLFIIADEFAELKQQEPEFMDELISAARIGRSLGVHLVLATQKPTGVVNDQIWSNARFKVCLKVADSADSTEMIRRPDAAELQHAGRFYLLVGYNEYFALGQSGYAGTAYIPSDYAVGTRDDSAVLISNTGRALVTVKPHKAESKTGVRPESVVLLALLQDVAKRLGLSARRLWLNPIPELITVDGIAEKYGRSLEDTANTFVLNPIIGEYDDPARQRQELLSLPLSAAGNALIYGMSDSGVECALFAAIYSMLLQHSPRSVNIYVLDFGSESLRAFAGAPQVGDVVGVGDEEKLTRFFDFIEAEFIRRRNVLVPYGGSFEQYSATNDDMPNIVVVINNIGVLIEAYEHLEDRLSHLTQNAGRYGVYLLATAAGTSAIRVRMRQNFRQVAACNLADESDYGMLFGSMRGVPIPKGYGRGLIRLEDGLFEFQSARLSNASDDYDVALATSRACAEKARDCGETPAAPIPVAPQSVTPDMLKVAAHDAFFVPYGIYDSDLKVAGFDFTGVPMARCVYQRRKDGLAFIRAFIAAQASVDACDLALLDMSGALGDEKPEGLVFGTRKQERATGYLKNLIRHGARKADERPLLVVVTGIMDFMNQQVKDFQTGEDFGRDFKEYLKALRSDYRVGFLLIDASTDNSYAFEDWFKAQLTSKDGLWVGPGVDGQTSIGTAYSARFIADAQMNEKKGYEISGGSARLVHLVSRKDEK